MGVGANNSTLRVPVVVELPTSSAWTAPSWLFWGLAGPVMAGYALLTCCFVCECVAGAKTIPPTLRKYKLMPGEALFPSYSSDDPADSTYELMNCESEKDVQLVLKSEIFVKSFGPVAGFLFGMLTRYLTPVSMSPEGNMPIWAWLPALMLAGRAKYAESRYLGTSVWSLIASDWTGWKYFPGMPFMASVPASFDGYAHGLAVAAALVRETAFPYVTNRFIQAWSSENTAFVGNIATVLHITGILALTTIISIIFEVGCALSCGVNDENHGKDTVTLATLAGFGAIEGHVAAKLSLKQHLIGVQEVGTTKTIGNGLPSLFWQSSFVMACGTSLFKSSSLAINIILSCFLALQCSVKCFRASVWTVHHSDEDSIAYCVDCSLLAIMFGMVCFSIYLIVRVVMLQVCDSHEWGMSTGCLPTDSSTSM